MLWPMTLDFRLKHKGFYDQLVREPADEVPGVIVREEPSLGIYTIFGI